MNLLDIVTKQQKYLANRNAKLEIIYLPDLTLKYDYSDSWKAINLVFHNGKQVAKLFRMTGKTYGGLVGLNNFLEGYGSPNSFEGKNKSPKDGLLIWIIDSERHSRNEFDEAKQALMAIA